MLSSQNKITQSEFKEFYNKGIKKSSTNLRVSFLSSKKNKNTKYSVVISKRVVKTAVLRNKNKRIIYKILRQIYPQFLTLDYVFIFIQRDIQGIDKSILKQELIELLTKK